MTNPVMPISVAVSAFCFNLINAVKKAWSSIIERTINTKEEGGISAAQEIFDVEDLS
mgnify:CR=1 FL=1